MTLQNLTPPATALRFGLVAGTGLAAGAAAGLLATVALALAAL